VFDHEVSKIIKKISVRVLSRRDMHGFRSFLRNQTGLGWSFGKNNKKVNPALGLDLMPSTLLIM